MRHVDLNDFHTRRSERAPLRCAVSFRAGEGRTCYGWSEDISLGGIYVVTDDRERLGTPCRIGLAIKWGGTTHRLTAHGQVARYDGRGIAFQFSGVPEALQALIVEIVEAHIRAEMGTIRNPGTGPEPPTADDAPAGAARPADDVAPTARDA